MYGHIHPDFVTRRFGTDLYMLGNLAAFLFSGANITEILFAKLKKQFHWTKWNADYPSVLPYLQEAFARVLEELEPVFPERIRIELSSILCQLCNPDLSNRGHPRGIGRFDQYSLERYVSLLDILIRRLTIGEFQTRRIA